MSDEPITDPAESTAFLHRLQMRASRRRSNGGVGLGHRCDRPLELGDAAPQLLELLGVAAALVREESCTGSIPVGALGNPRKAGGFVLG